MVALQIMALALGLTTLVGLVVALGWWLAMEHLAAFRRSLHLQRNLLDAEWRALDQTRRVREVFLAARRNMQQQANQDEQRGGRA